MYYGHGSWTILVLFGALVAFRALSSRRRRLGRPPPPVSTRSFTRFGISDPGVPSAGGPTRQTGNLFTGVAAGWLPDPTAKHEQRFWSGTEWTDQVIDDGIRGTDPPPHSLK